jgi:RND superfamily putative drug exporter
VFASLGKLAFRRRWLILAAGLIFVIISGVASYKLSESLKIGGFIDPNSDSTRAAQLAESQLGREQGLLVVLFTSRNGTTIDQPQYRQDLENILGRFAAVPGVGKFVNFFNTGLAQFVSNDRKSTYVVLGLPGDDDAQFKTIEKLEPLATDTSLLQVRLGGRPAVNYEIVKQAETDLIRAELLTFPVVGIMLFFIFRSLVAACLPLLTGGTAILGAYLILRIASNFTSISVFALNIITMLGLGLSIDYSLFVISRFREELKMYNGQVAPALTRTMQTAGHTVFFSGLTVIISLLSLLVFEPQFLKSMGFGGASAVLVAMIASLTILPAILALLGEKVNLLSVNSFLPWRKNRPAAAPGEEIHSGYWYRISQFVMRRPILVLVLTLVPLLWIGSPFLRINFSTFDARTLPNNHASRQVSNILDSEFPPNETTPVEIVVSSRTPVLEASAIEALFDYTHKLQTLPGVLRVDSLVTVDPNLDKAAYVAFYSEASRAQNPQAAQLVQRFSQGNFTLVNVIHKDNKFAGSTQDLVRQIRDLNVPLILGVTVGGETASLVDLLSSLGKSLPLSFALIVIILFVLLFLMLGSLVVPLKAVILNILSLSACFGTLVWIFQDGHFADFLGFTPTGTIDSTQPVLVFAGAFGLSLDYEVFLLSRIKEHYDRTNDLRSSVALGVQKTGGIITSAALLLVVVIGSFVTGEVLFIKQIGLGLAVAILVDATVVRTLLLPASMRLMGKYNWWAPGPLVKLHHKLGLSEREPEPEYEAEPARPVAPPVRLKPTAASQQQPPALQQQPLQPQPPLRISNGQPQIRTSNGQPLPGPTNAPLQPPAFGQTSPVFNMSNNRPDALPAIPVMGVNNLDEAQSEELINVIKQELARPLAKGPATNTVIQQLNQLGELCKSLGREDEAVEYYERTLKLMRETGFEELNQVLVLTQLSSLFLELQNAQKGIPVSLEGLQLSRRTAQAAAEFTFLANLVEFSLKLQDLKKAKSFAWQAFQLAQRRSDSSRLRRAERMLAGVEAREELQFNSQGLGGFQGFTGSFKNITGNSSARPAPPSGPSPTAPEQATSLYNRGKRLQNEKDYYQAIEAYRQALVFDPRMVKAYVNRAISFNAIGEPDKALEDYNRALEIEQTDPDIWFNRGNIYILRKAYPQAAQDYTRAILLNPTDPDPYFNRAEAYRKQGQNDKAVADLHKVIELSQDVDQFGVRQARLILSKIEETTVYK